MLESIRLTLDFERPLDSRPNMYLPISSPDTSFAEIFRPSRYSRNCSISLKYELSVFSDTFFFFLRYSPNLSLKSVIIKTPLDDHRENAPENRETVKQSIKEPNTVIEMYFINPIQYFLNFGLKSSDPSEKQRLYSSEENCPALRQQ